MQKQYEDGELYHHGIVGMKWGSRNGPPYPLKKNVSKQIKKGNNPQYKKDEAYRKEREKLKKGEDVETVGFSLGKKKRKLFDKTAKAQQVTPQEDAVNKVQEMIDENNKYLHTDTFGSKDLNRLTQRYNDETAYNEALARKYRSENDMLINRANKLSGLERRKYEKMVKKYETEAAYNRAIQSQIQSQIDLLTTKQTLKQLKTKPKKEGLITRGRKAVGEVLATSAKRVGTEATTILFGELLNQGLNALYTKNKKHANPLESDMPNPFFKYDSDGKGKNKNKGGGNSNQNDGGGNNNQNNGGGSNKGGGSDLNSALNAINSLGNVINKFASDNSSSANKSSDIGSKYTYSYFDKFGSKSADSFSDSIINAGKSFTNDWNDSFGSNTFLDENGKLHNW